MSIYGELEKDSEESNEKNDCAVIALAAVCNISYDKAHKTLASIGRKNKKGTQAWMTMAALSYLGFTAIEVKHHYPEVKTIKTLKHLPKRGAFLIYIRKHIFAFINGEMIDSENNKNRKHHIKNIKQIFSKHSKIPLYKEINNVGN